MRAGQKASIPTAISSGVAMPTATCRPSARLHSALFRAMQASAGESG